MDAFEQDLTRRLSTTASQLEPTPDWEAVLLDAGFSDTPEQNRRAWLMAAAAAVVAIAGWLTISDSSNKTEPVATTVDAGEPHSELLAPLGPEPLFDTSTLGQEQPGFDRSGFDEIAADIEALLPPVDAEVPAFNGLTSVIEPLSWHVLGERSGTWSAEYRVLLGNGETTTCWVVQDADAQTTTCDGRSGNTPKDTTATVVPTAGGSVATTRVPAWVSVVAWETDGVRQWQRPTSSMIALTLPGESAMPELTLFYDDGTIYQIRPGDDSIFELSGPLPGETVLGEDPLITIAATGPTPKFDTSALGQEVTYFEQPTLADVTAWIDSDSLAAFPISEPGDEVVRITMVGQSNGKLTGTVSTWKQISGEVLTCFFWEFPGFGGASCPVEGGTSPFPAISDLVNPHNNFDIRVIGVGPDISVVSWVVAGEQYWQRPIGGFVGIDVSDFSHADLTEFNLHRDDGRIVEGASHLFDELRASIPFVPTVLPGEVVLSEDPLVVLAASGPEPQFDTSPLGAEVAVMTQPEVDPIWLYDIIRQSDPSDLKTLKITALGAVDGLWSWEHQYESASPLPGDAAVMNHRMYWYIGGASGVDGPFPFSVGPNEVSSFTPPTAQHAWIDVPVDTAAVSWTSDGREEWQRPTGGVAVFVRHLGPTESAIVVAYDAQGQILAESTLSGDLPVVVDDDTGLSISVYDHLFPVGSTLGRIRAYDRDGNLVEIETAGEPIVFLIGDEWCKICQQELATLNEALGDSNAIRYVYLGGTTPGDLIGADLWGRETYSIPGFGALSPLRADGVFPVHAALVIDGDKTVLGMTDNYSQETIEYVLTSGG